MSNKTALLRALDDVSSKSDRNIRLYIQTIGDQRANFRHAAALAVAIPLTLLAGTLADAAYLLVSHSNDIGPADDAASRTIAPTDLDHTA